MSLTVAIVTGLWYWFWTGLPGYSLFAVCKQPIIIGTVVGALMGDLEKGIIVGSSIEVVYLGMVAAGGNIPSDKCLAALIAIPIAIAGNIEPEVAITIAVPIGILGVFVNNIRRTTNAWFAAKADKYAEEANIKGIWRCATLYPLAFGFIFRFPIVFVANLFGATFVEKVLQAIPEWLMRGLIVTGGVLPALGFATTIFVIGKNKYIPFFILGFFIVQYFHIPITAAAIFGICIAFLCTFMKEDKEGA